ncbi:MAG: hypothetical protein AAGA93_04595 [Actinomycetota bacterium]
MGTQDSLDLAQQFVERHGTNTPLMTWDASFETWIHYGVRGQPFTILVDPSGQPLGDWFGVTQEMVQLVDEFGA